MEHKTYLASCGIRFGKSYLRNLTYEDNKLVDKKALEGINKIYDKELFDTMTFPAEPNTIFQPTLLEETMQKMADEFFKIPPPKRYIANPFNPGEVFEYAPMKHEYEYEYEWSMPEPIFPPCDTSNGMCYSLVSRMYGRKIIQHTQTIYLKKQARTHRKKRINNKWKNRYGYIDVPREVSSIPCMVGTAL